MLDRIVRGKLLQARAALGFYAANADPNDDILVYKDDTRQALAGTIHTLRQQMAKPPGRPNLAMSDFVAPQESGVADYVGLFAVTTGIGLDTLVREFEAANDDYSAILAKALADRLAEAFAERLHERVRREFWGYAPDEQLSNEELVQEKYQGIRPAPGYPSCPDHTEKPALFRLIEAESRAGMQLTESFAMLPAASVSGYYFWNPASQYFGLGRIGKDQVEDYARRKGMSVPDVERWLAPNLGYER
jgi:5-methyltetrahydrofolate--homocysteine methyltransferase